MKIKAIIFKNFRAYKGEIVIPVEDITAFVGRNDIGKSSILEGLGIFLEGGSGLKFEASDACVHTDDPEVRIGVQFTDLPTEIIIDATSKTTLSDEYLLNESGDLEIHRVWKCAGGRVKEQPTVAIATHPSAKDADDLLMLMNDDLKVRAKKLGVDLEGPGVDKRVNAQIRKAIWSSLEDCDLRQTQIPLNDQDAKAILDQLRAAMPAFALFKSDRPSTDQDDEVQDPMKLAVKHALGGLEDQLSTIKAAVEKETLAVATRTLERLKELDPNLAKDLAPRFQSEPKWDGIFKLSLTSDDQIPLNKRGSGVRRLVLLSFFRAEAERKRQEAEKRDLIYAIEEPEASQHPDNQIMLLDALRELAESEGCQVLLTTHVPALAGMLPVESIRHVVRNPDSSNRVDVGSDAILAEVADDLGILPDARVKLIICLEGPHDVRWLRTTSKLIRENDAQYPDLEADKRIVVLPLGGSTLKDWVGNHYLRQLHLPEIHIYDRGSEVPPTYQETCDRVNGRGDGSKAYLTDKAEAENYLHADAVKAVYNFDVTIEDTTDVPEVVARRVYEEGGGTSWDQLDPESRKKKISRAKSRLNDEVAQNMTVDLIKERGGYEEICGWLTEIKDRL